MKNKFILCGVFLMALSFPACAQSAADCSDYSISFTGVSEIDGDYLWTYRVCQSGSPAISHWVLEACLCSGYPTIADCMEDGALKGYGSDLPGVELEYGTDPTTGVTGFKFDDLEWPEDYPECATFRLLTQITGQELKDVAVKAATTACTNYPQVIGPAHYSVTTSTTEPSTSTTEPSTTTTEPSTTTTEPPTTTTTPEAGEFASVGILAAVLLSAPAFAYLLVRSRK